MKFRRIISLFLVVVIFTITITHSYNAIEANVEFSQISNTYNNTLNKLHFYFQPVDNKTNVSTTSLFSNKKTEETPYLYIDDTTELNEAIEDLNISHNYASKESDTILMTVEFSSAYFETMEYIDFNEKLSSAQNISEIRRIRKELNSFSKQYHYEENERNKEILSIFKYESINITEYAPFIKIEIDIDNLDAEKLVTLAQNESVSNVSIRLSEEYVDTALSWEDSMEAINAIDAIESVHSEETCPQNEIRIGIFEGTGICDVDHPNLSGIDITTDTRLDDISDHATAVTAIVSKMMPCAKYFVSYIHMNGLDWFIENECDIVNCSYSTQIARITSDGTYESLPAKYDYDVDGLFDYQIRGHRITVVVAAGNKGTDNKKDSYNPDGKIYSPGLAYNAITVGGIEQTGLIIKRLRHHDEASYVSSSSYIKPEISAMYDIEHPELDSSAGGTSFSAPQVTGAIALLFEKEPGRISQPEVVKARLMASAAETYDYDATRGEFDERVGAGVLDVDKFLNNCTSGITMIYDAFDYSNEVTGYTLIYLPKNANLQAALAWHSATDLDNDQHYITDYNLRLYNEDGTQLLCESSLGANSNVELLKYKTSSAGNYRLAIYINGEMPTFNLNDYVGKAYSYTTSLF